VCVWCVCHVCGVCVWCVSVVYCGMNVELCRLWNILSL